ncbi:MAG: hypothetical protein IPK03_10745 [Bacteroidetes bacterium]|nr:hypothetical protein [Bacteroidota bacterium]
MDYYYGANDSIGWIDMKYYPGRDKEESIASKWGKKLGYPVQTTKQILKEEISSWMEMEEWLPLQWFLK